MSGSAFKPARPPPTTPMGQRGGMGMASPFGMDSAPPTPGEDVVGGHGNILRNRLSTSQGELARVKRELKAANEKALQLSLKLNEEKVAKVALTNKYSSVVARVKEFDERMREAEDIIKNERQVHKELQRGMDNLRDQLRAKQDVVDQQHETLRRHQQDRDEEAKDWKDNLDRSSGTAEVLKERHVQFMEYYKTLVTDSLDRMVEDREGKDTLVTVVTSELTSTITEQQQMLQRLTFENEGMKDSLRFLIKEVEEESNALVLTLLRENKEVWGQLNTTRADLARFKDADKSRLSKIAESHLTEQIDTLQSENKQLEERLRKTSESLRVNTEKARGHEKTLQQLMENLQMLEAEKTKATDQNIELTRTSKDLQSKIRILETDLQDISRVRGGMQGEINNYKQTVSSLNETHQATVTQIKIEMDRERLRLTDEVKAVTRRMKEEEAEKHKIKVNLVKVTEQLTVVKRSYEDDRNLAVQQLKEELILSKDMYEREIDDLRHDIDAKNEELTVLHKTVEKERIEGTSMRMEFGALSKSVVDLRAENQALHDETKRLMEKNQDRSRELDIKRSELLDYETQLRTITQDHERVVKEKIDEIHRVEEDCRKLRVILKNNQKKVDELESVRLSLERENHTLSLAAGRDGRRSRGELEKDKELLSAENQRILKQYEEVNEQNTRLLGELGKMRDRAGNEQILHDQVLMYQRQLAMMEQQADDLQEARETIARTESEIDELRRERDTIQTRLDTILEESSTLHRKEAELDQCVEAADQQIRRLEQQMERASAYTASLPRGTSPTYTETPSKYY